MVELYDYQQEAVSKMKNGCILCGGVGSGKSRTALAYYVASCDGHIPINNDGLPIRPMQEPRDLYIITTAKKRDSNEWIEEADAFRITTNPETNIHGTKIIIDSWNNIKNYVNVNSAFFIFDEQRVVGSGVWVKSFLKIAKKNHWILLSATPGDTWMDYWAVFVANGFYRNKTDFASRHVVYSRFAKYPKVDGYYDKATLNRHRHDILVVMKDPRTTERHNVSVMVDYSKTLYKMVWKDRWNVFENTPIEETGELCYVLRRVVNSDRSREVEIIKLLEEHQQVIIFYNYDYELEILRNICQCLGFYYAEWNGHKHEPCPDEHSEWVYLVQYNAGSEAWNCITTDTIIFYSQNYSYKIMEQASGRIDRINTPFHDLYYYHLRSRAPIDLGIRRALENKKKFNETAFVKEQQK